MGLSLKVEILNKNSSNHKATSIIEISGNTDEVREAEKLIKKIPKIQTLYEGDARVLIQQVIDEHNLKADIMFDGNKVYSKKKILSNVDLIIKKGLLGDSKGARYLSDYFYDFLYQECGSIAHFCKDGWIETYPTLADLKAFFAKNEFDQRVLESLPDWDTDAKIIVQAIEDRFYPLRARIRAAKLLAAK
jgi:hypothetical protein